MRVLAPLAALFVALALLATAFAHAEPARVTPGDGAVLAARPGQVEITMSQDMARQEGANDIEVFDASAKKVTTVAAVIDNGDRSKLSVPLPSDLPVGTYTVKWKSLSADDGDPASGSLSFTYDPSKPPTPGKEVLREDLLGGSTPAAATDVPSYQGGPSSTPWVLMVAVGLGAFVIGSGATFLFVQKRP